MSRILFLAPALLGLFACSSNPDLYARYEPTGKDDVWSKGMRLHTVQAPGMEISSGFVGKTHEVVRVDTSYTAPIRFSVRVANSGDSPVIIEPTRFRLWSPESSLAFRSINPEEVIRQADRNFVNERDRYAASQGVEALLILPMLFVSIAETDPEKQEKNEEFWKDKREADRDEKADHEEKLAAAEKQRDAWSELSLRKTTLFPGKDVHGLINFVDEDPSHRPDTLVLQYRQPSGEFLDLGRYSRLVDSVPIVERKKKKKEKQKIDRSIGPYYP